MVWGALLGVSLQARAIELAPTRSLTAYGTLAIAGASVAAFTQILAGLLSDRRRRRGSRRIEFYAAGAIVGAAALVWFYSASTFTQLVAATIVLQVAMNIAIGPYQAAIPDFIEERRFGSASSWMAGLQSLGNAAGAVVAGFIADARAVAAILCGALLAGCAVTSLHVRRLQPGPHETTAVWISREFGNLFISRALVYVGFYTLLGYLLFYVSDLPGMHGAEIKRFAGFLLLLFTVAGAAGAWLGSAPARGMDRRTLATIGGSVFIASLLIFLAITGAIAVPAATLAAGASWGVFLTADWSLGCRFLPRSALATAMAFWNLALLLPQILAPLIATAAIGGLHQLHTGRGPKVAFLVAALEVACGIAWLWRLPAFRAEFV